MINWKYNSLFILVFLFFSFLGEAQGVTYQTPISDDGTLQSENSIVVASVEISEARITNQAGNSMDINFSISNKGEDQTDLQYLVRLIEKKDEGVFTLADWQLPAEEKILYSNQKINKKFNYLAPSYLAGNFEIWIFVEDKSGLSFGAVKVGEISLDGQDQYLEIVNESCFLKIDGDLAGEKFFLEQGVVVKKDEKIILNCEVWNHFDDVQSFNSQTKTYRRKISSGEEVETEKLAQEANLVLNPQEKKHFEFTLPRPSTPQAYDSQLELSNSAGAVISNKAIAHYVVHGNSATIQNVNLDKNYYKYGDIANISFNWSGAADNFFDSRAISDKSGKTLLNISLVNAENKKECASTQLDLTDSFPMVKFALQVMTECFNPIVETEIVDEDENILDKKESALISQVASSERKIAQKQEKESVETIASAESKARIFIVVMIISTAVLLFSGFFLIVRFIKKRK